MSDSSTSRAHDRRSRVMTTTCTAILAAIVVTASLRLGCSGSGVAFVTTGSFMTSGALGCTVAIDALKQPFAANATPRGEGR